MRQLLLSLWILWIAARYSILAQGPVTENLSKSVPILDISPPNFSPGFVCGRSAVKTVSNFRRFKKETRVVAAPITEFPIVGGIDAKRNAWPWMALVGTHEGSDKHNWFCAGALVNHQWILTAAHCLDEKTPNVVRLGEHDYNDDNDEALHEDFEIQTLVPHPNYTFPMAYHDIALLKLSRNVPIQTYISPVCLPWGGESQVNLVGRQVKLTGWGDTQFLGKPSSILQEVDVTVFPTLDCQRSYSKLRQFRLHWPYGIGKETTCAGDRNGGRDACQGDSGGPSVYVSKGKYIVNGVISKGNGCGSKNYPGLYANVQQPPHLAWIKKVAFGVN